MREPLIFLHGLGSSSRDWALQMAFFSRHFDTIACDLRGHGRSDKPPGPYAISQFAADVGDLLDQLKVGPANVVGLSLGGVVAFQMAADTPEALRRMVIVNSAPAIIARNLKERLRIWQRLALARMFSVRRTGIFLSKRLFPKEEHAEIRQQFVTRWAENDPRAYRAAMRALVGWSVEERLETMTTPTLVIAADQDYTPVSYKQAYVARMPNARLEVIPDSRHGTPVEQPERFNRVVYDFLVQ